MFGLDEQAEHTGLPGLIGGLLTQPPQDPRSVVTGRRSLVLKTLLERSGMGRRRPRVISAYELGDLIDEEPGWQDFQGTHRRYTDERVRIRIYHAGTATTSEDRAQLDRAAEREYRLLRHLEHPGLVAPMQHVDTDTGPALVYPLDERAVRLDHLLGTQSDALPLDRRLTIIRGMAEILRYAHGRHITHRGLTPRSVFVRLDTPSPMVRTQLEGHLRRLEASPLPRRAFRDARQHPLAQRPVRLALRDLPCHARGGDRLDTEGAPHAARRVDPDRGTGGASTACRLGW